MGEADPSCQKKRRVATLVATLDVGTILDELRSNPKSALIIISTVAHIMQRRVVLRVASTVGVNDVYVGALGELHRNQSGTTGVTAVVARLG